MHFFLIYILNVSRFTPPLVEKKLGYHQKHFAFFRVANLIKWKFSFPKWSLENKVIKTFFDFDETQS